MIGAWQRTITIVIWGVIGVGGALIAWQMVTPATATAEPVYVTPHASSVQRPEPLAVTPALQPTIYITGAVMHPGVYVFDAERVIRIVDVVMRAGGLRHDADETAINLAAPIADATHVHVPSVHALTQQSDRPTSAAPDTAADGQVVNLNTASADELSELPGVGPALAQRIIDFREQHGPFTSIDDLDAVSGVGPALLSKLASAVSVSE